MPKSYGKGATAVETSNITVYHVLMGIILLVVLGAVLGAAIWANIFIWGKVF